METEQKLSGMCRVKLHGFLNVAQEQNSHSYS